MDQNSKRVLGTLVSLSEPNEKHYWPLIVLLLLLALIIITFILMELFSHFDLLHSAMVS